LNKHNTTVTEHAQ